MLLTKIPMFRDIIVISFHCPHCGNSNNEIQENSPTQTDGIEYTVAINEPTVRKLGGNKEHEYLFVGFESSCCQS